MSRSPLDRQEIIAFIRQSVNAYNNAEMAALIERKYGVKVTAKTLRSFSISRKLFGNGSTRGYRRGASEKVFTDWQKDIIAWLCTTHNDRQLSELFREKFGVERTPEQFESFRNNNHIKSGRTGYFHTAENPGYRPPKGIHISPATEFKKGNRPKSWKPVGSEVTDRDGYTLVKVGDTGTQRERWKFKARLEWEKANGEIGAGWRVIHIDGDRQNDSIENLRLISNKTLLEVNRTGGLYKDQSELNSARISVCEIAAKLRKQE